MFSVSELTRAVRELLERGLGEVWVEGEISNHRKQASGHQYFTLKDNGCQLACVLFSRSAAALGGLKIADGLCVQAFGEITVYEARGQYQMIVRHLQAKGAGALQAKFEALKAQLAAEGLFDAARKRPLPRFPRRIGLVTSPTGAAIRDFLHVLHRRHPGLEVLINPVRVQGKGASQEIARAVREFGTPGTLGLPPVDVIVLTRGGGSIEDLWEFNEEIVARAIAASPLPVLSAIGHEIDFTISDFVADLRAPTPSAAAEILAADRTEVLNHLRQDAARLSRAVAGRLQLLEVRLANLRQSPLFREPPRRLLELRQTLDRTAENLDFQIGQSLSSRRQAILQLSTRLAAHAPRRAIQEVRLQARLHLQALAAAAQRELTARRARLERAAHLLEALNPLATLARGYTVTSDESGIPLASAEAVRKGETLRTRFSDGEVRSKVS